MDEDAVSLARLILAVRDDRARFFSADLFDEQSWELMLVLFVMRHDRQSIDRNTLVDRNMASPAALDRWIGVLLARSIITRADPSGEITLTDDAARRMNDLLRSNVQARA